MTAVERNLHDRVAKLETQMDVVTKGTQEIKEEIRGLRDSMQQGFRDLSARIDHLESHFDVRIDSWLKWVLGFIFSSWFTIMTTLLLKH